MSSHKPWCVVRASLGPSRRVLVLAWLLVACSSALGASVDEVLTKAGTGPLTAAECGQLSQALKDKSLSAKWADIARALRANWDKSAVTAWGQVELIKENAEFTAEEKTRLAGALYELFSAQGAVLKQLDAGESAGVVNLLWALGEKAKASELLADWLSASDAWKTKANADQLPSLMQGLRESTTEAVSAQKAALTELAWTKYLAANAPERAKLNLAQLMFMTWTFQGQLSPERAKDWGGRLLTILKDPQAVSTAKLEAVRVAKSLRVEMGVAAEYPDIAATWISASAQWKDLMDYPLVLLAKSVESGQSDLAKKQKGKLPALFMEKYFGAGAAAAPFAKAVELSRQMYPILSLAQKRQVADKLSPAAAQAQDIVELADLAELIRQAERIGPGTGHAEYATALARLLRSGATIKYGHLMAMPLGTPQTRAAITAELTDAAGMVRRNAAWVLGWSYFLYESTDAWKRLLNQKLADASITGDKKAGWLLARADAELLLVGPGAVSPLAGKAWIDQALAAGTSEAMKLRCVETLALGLVGVQQTDKAKSLLASVDSQFQSPESRTKLTELGKQVEALAGQMAEGAKRQSEASDAKARDLHIQELKSRLAAAKVANNRAEIERYERLLSNYK